jgi:hypothetical protein
MFNDRYCSKKDLLVGNIFKISAILLSLWLFIASFSKWETDPYEIVIEKPIINDIKIDGIPIGKRIIGDEYEIKVENNIVYLDYKGKWRKIKYLNSFKLLYLLEKRKRKITIQITEYKCVEGIDFLIKDETEVIKIEEVK